MITQEFRPKTFKDVAGQKQVVSMLKCIAKNPKSSPKTIILQGEFGTGKTTNARILARALNCPNAVNGEPCGNCSVCNSDLDISPFYTEYDSAVVGGVDQIRALRETFYYNSDNGYRIIVFDECHLISQAAQAALLKVFEETTGNLFFVLCTTDADKLLPTIRSRSLELRLNLISDEDLLNNLKGICEKKGMQVPEEALKLMVRRSLGHARNAQMLLDQYFLLGDEFQSFVKTSQDEFGKLFCLAKTKTLIAQKANASGNPEIIKQAKDRIELIKEEYAKIIGELQANSLVNLKVDYENAVLDVLKTVLKSEVKVSKDRTDMLPIKESEYKYIRDFAELIKQDVITHYEILTKDSIITSFKSDKQFQAAMWILYLSL